MTQNQIVNLFSRDIGTASRTQKKLKTPWESRFLVLQDALLKKIRKSHILQKIARYGGFLDEKDVFVGRVTLLFSAKKSHHKWVNLIFEFCKKKFF